MKKIVCILGFLVGIFSFVAIDPNIAIFSRKMEMQPGKTKAETTIYMAKSFLESPYVASTLEQTPEKLVCNLKTFDCYTFVENVLALTRAIHTRKVYSQYVHFLQQMRYRNGEITDYASRIHYFLEWKQQGEQQGWFTDITAQLGGVKVNPSINFMTVHRNMYAALEDDDIFQKIHQVEAKLSQIEWYMIPKSQVAPIETKLQDGDIIGITSTIAGLDFNHEGFVIRKGNRAHLLHASSDAKKVIISEEPLADYLQRIKKHSGIVVLRLKE